MDWDWKQKSLGMVLIETKGWSVTRKRVGGQEHLKIPPARREFKSFQELEESQYGWGLKGKVMRGKIHS